VQRAFNDKVLADYRSSHLLTQFATIFIAIWADSSAAKPCILYLYYLYDDTLVDTDFRRLRHQSHSGGWLTKRWFGTSPFSQCCSVGGSLLILLTPFLPLIYRFKKRGQNQKREPWGTEEFSSKFFLGFYRVVLDTFFGSLYRRKIEATVRPILWKSFLDLSIELSSKRGIKGWISKDRYTKTTQPSTIPNIITIVCSVLSVDPPHLIPNGLHSSQRASTLSVRYYGITRCVRKGPLVQQSVSSMTSGLEAFSL
jgi:hypothetical protein